jgi:hypothetical protein
MIDIPSLKPGQLVRYIQPERRPVGAAIQSLWILLEEEIGAHPLGRVFKLYQIYDSENFIDPQHSTVSYIFNTTNAKDFTLEVA